MSGTEEGRAEWCKMGAQWTVMNSIVWGISWQPVFNDRSINSKESENNVCLWGENVTEIKDTYDCNDWHCLQYSKGPCMPVPEHDHSAIIQDIIPDTLHSTDCAVVVDKDLCSCTCLGDQLFFAGCTSSCGCPSENAGMALNQSGAADFPTPLVLCALPSVFLFVSSQDLSQGVQKYGCPQ